MVFETVEAIQGRRHRARQHAIRCHFDGEGHSPIIRAGKDFYEVREGEAQGVYHGPQCYQAALTNYKRLKEKAKTTITSSEDNDDYELSDYDD